MPRNPHKSGGKASLLRENGFLPVPLLWVKRDQLERIMEIARESKAEYDALSAMYRRWRDPEPRRDMTREDEIEAAWRARNG